MCRTEYAEGGAKLHHPAQDRARGQRAGQTQPSERTPAWESRIEFQVIQETAIPLKIITGGRSFRVR